MGIERQQVVITMVSVDTRVGFMTCRLQLRRLASSSSRSPPAYFEGFRKSGACMQVGNP